MRSSPFRRGVRSHVRLSVGLALLMMMSAQSGVFMDMKRPSEELSDFRIMESSVRTSNLVDAPAWKVNDVWHYDGYLDVVEFVASSGVSTNVQYLDGTLTERVMDIYTMVVDGEATLVYKVESDGYYEANDINLDGNNGDLVVEMDTEEIFRVSDLASIQYTATFDIDFVVQIADALFGLGQGFALAGGHRQHHRHAPPFVRLRLTEESEIAVFAKDTLFYFKYRIETFAFGFVGRARPSAYLFKAKWQA